MDAHIIIAGDSNPLGFLNTGPAPYANTVRVQIWALQSDGSYAWNYMNPGVNTGTPANSTVWGSEVQIANRWLSDNPTGYLWIVKNAETVKGGTTLAVDWNPTTGPFFASTTHSVNAAMHNLDGGQFAFTSYDAAFIGLGENDATDSAMAANYYDHMMALNTAARAAWHVTDLVEYRITEGAGTAANNLAVRQAQWRADQDDSYLTTFKTIGLVMRPDGIHYADHVALGNLNYDGWIA